MNLKCPSGHGILPIGERICPYCSVSGIPVDENSISENDELSFDNLIGNLENNLKKINSLKKPTIFKIFNKDNSFEILQAEAAKNKNQILLYYRENRKALDITSDTDKKLELIKAERLWQSRKSKVIFISLLIFCMVAVVFIFYSPLPEPEENLTENQKIERVNFRIDKYLEENKYDEANNEADKLGMFKKTEALRRIQIKKTNDEFNIVKKLIDSNQLFEAEKRLNQINWEPVENPKFDLDKKELIRNFKIKKEEFNNLINKK